MPFNVNIDFLLLIFALFVFISSLITAKKTDSSLAIRFLFTIIFFIFILISLTYVVADYFTGNGIDESVTYHLEYGFGGAGYGEYWKIIAISIVLFCLATLMLYCIYRRREDSINLKGGNYISLFLISSSLFVNPGSYEIFDQLLKPRINLGKIALLQIDESIHHPKIVERDKLPNAFQTNYESPYLIKKEGSGKNLVYIHLESLERTYFDENIFPGLIKGLRKLEGEGMSFTQIGQVRATNWTIAGMVAAQCGIPLFAASHGNTMSGMDSFLTNAVCLGNLMKDEGYSLSYRGGASLDFAGKGKFYRTHKFDDVSGRDELMPRLPNKKYRSAWGLYDDSLLDLTFEDFLELSKKDENFGLFLLTLDTHHPKGHPSASCKQIKYGNGSNSILNAVACSDYLVTEFVNKIRKSPYGDNTIIVVASDHLSMKTDASHLLRKGDRKNLFLVLDGAIKRPALIKKSGSTLDIGPTILHFMGYESAIGLGRNLMGKEMTLVEKFKNVNDRLKSWKSEIIKLWDFPKIANSIEIEKEEIKLDGRSFRLPILINFNEELETELRFQFDIFIHKKLAAQLKDFEEEKAFLWVDKCRAIDKFMSRTGDSKDYCYMMGKKNGKLIDGKVTKGLNFSAGELKKMVLN